MTWTWLDERPIVVAIAGSNGAGKTTFYQAHLARSGLRFVNADGFAQEFDVDPYTAARLADNVRRELVRQRESFVFETVFSDPVGDKVRFLKETVAAGYTVVLCLIGIPDAETSEQRVSMRVSQGGHDVPSDKLESRFPRTLINLRLAIEELPRVIVFDNRDLANPFQRVAMFEEGKIGDRLNRLPAWVAQVIDLR